MTFEKWNWMLEIKFPNDSLLPSDVGYLICDEDLTKEEKITIFCRCLEWFEEKNKRNV